MNIIRVTKTSRNRVDVIFTGYQYLFFQADFGLVAVAKREMTGIQAENDFVIMRSEQISEEMIKSTIEKNESTFNNRLNKFFFSNEDNKPQHTLPYIVDVKLEIDKTMKKNKLELTDEEYDALRALLYQTTTTAYAKAVGYTALMAAYLELFPDTYKTLKEINNKINQ